MGYKLSNLSLALGMSLLTSGNVVANDNETRMDARCVVVSGQMAVSPDIGQRKRAEMLMLYYIGRLDGRTPGLDLEKLLASESARMTSANTIQSEMRRCNDALTAKGKEITRLGNDLNNLRR